jgi:hypothetical protein
LGATALQNVTTDVQNVGIGSAALGLLNASAGNNVAVGYHSLLTIHTGSNNVGIGAFAGNDYGGAETNNILIGYNVLGTLGESNTIRIGNTSNTSCYIQGIEGVTVANTNLVTINTATGQLGSTTINPSGFPWTDVTTATQALAVNHGYVTDHTNVTYTLPATAALGDTIKIVGKLGIMTIAQNAGQQIVVSSASSTVGVTGSVVGTNVGDCIELVCITAGASTIWRAANFVGNLTVN